MKNSKIYVVFYTRPEEPNYEFIKVYANEDDALNERDRLFADKECHYAYVISEILR